MLVELCILTNYKMALVATRKLIVRGSYAHAVGSNLAKTKVEPLKISKNTVNSQANKLNVCRAINVNQPTLLDRREGYSHNSNLRLLNIPQKVSKHCHYSSSEFQIQLQNRYESIHLSDHSDLNEEATAKLSTSKAQTKHKHIPVHKVSTWCKKVPNENIHCEQTADTVVQLSMSTNPNKGQNKCQKPHKMGLKIFWPHEKYELALEVKNKNKDTLQSAK